MEPDFSSTEPDSTGLVTAMGIRIGLERERVVIPAELAGTAVVLEAAVLFAVFFAIVTAGFGVAIVFDTAERVTALAVFVVGTMIFFFPGR